jgi:hypothetical protein
MQTVYVGDSFGRGSATAAGQGLNMGVFDNPASVGVQQKAYSFEGSYIQADNGFVLSFVDSHAVMAAGGIGYLQYNVVDGSTFRRVPLAVGKRFGPYVLGTNVSFNALPGNRQWSSDLGFLYFPFPFFTFGVTGKNFLGTKEEFEGRSVNVGMSFSFGIVDVSAQAGRDFQRTTTMSWGAGARLHLPFDIGLLGGIRQTGYEGKRPLWSAGLGYMSKGLALSGSYEQATQRPYKGTFLFSFTYADL